MNWILYINKIHCGGLYFFFLWLVLLLWITDLCSPFLHNQGFVCSLKLLHTVLTCYQDNGSFINRNALLNALRNCLIEAMYLLLRSLKLMKTLLTWGCERYCHLLCSIIIGYYVHHFIFFRDNNREKKGIMSLVMEHKAVLTTTLHWTVLVSVTLFNGISQLLTSDYGCVFIYLSALSGENWSMHTFYPEF